MANLLEIIFFALAACYLFEQIFYRIAGSYPFRHGFVVKTINLPYFDLRYWDSTKTKISSLSIKTKADKGEVYIRYNYPYMAIGPLLFIGQIKKINTSVILQIKVGPLSCLFVLFLIVYPFISMDIFNTPVIQVMNLFCLGAILAFLYFVLVTPIKGIIESREETTS